MDICKYLQMFMDHKQEIVMALTSIVTIASMIAKYTPDTHDDDFVNALLKFVNYLALNKTK